MPVMGPKGQIVISKEIRDRLGIGPGWLAIERVVDDHVEIHFVPPKHNRSLFGILRPSSDVSYAHLSEEEYNEMLDRSIERAIAEEWEAKQTALRDLTASERP
ncbi:MAG: hypothetical protein AMXMBFR23_04200 [Chloroflexota bacterium]